MKEIYETREMTRYLAEGSSEIIEFPENVNVLFNDESMDESAVLNLENIGRCAGRSLHMR